MLLWAEKLGTRGERRMSLGTTWKDSGALLFHGSLCAGAFFGVALVHWFVIPGLPLSPGARTTADYLLLVPLLGVVHLFWSYAIGKAERNPYRRAKGTSR